MKNRGLRSIEGGGVHILGQKRKAPQGIALTGVRITAELARQLPPFIEEAKGAGCTCPDGKLTVHLNVAPDKTLSVILGHEKDCPRIAPPVAVVADPPALTLDQRVDEAARDLGVPAGVLRSADEMAEIRRQVGEIEEG